MDKRGRILYLGLVVAMVLIVGGLIVFPPPYDPQPTGRLGDDCAANPRQVGASLSPNNSQALTYHDILGFAHNLLNGRHAVDAEHIWANLSTDEAQTRREAMKSYGLEPITANGKFSSLRLTGWQGWVARIAPGLYAQEKNLYTIGLYLDNPFPGAPTNSDRPAITNEYSDVNLCCLSTNDAQTLSIGQPIVFCGEIGNTTLMRAEQIIVDVGTPIIRPLANASETISHTIPADFRVRLEEHGCGDGYICPDFSIEIAASGVVTYRGASGVRVGGTITGQADPRKLKELVHLIEQTDIFVETGVRPAAAPLEAGATLITITMDGQQRTLAWPWEQAVPRRVQLLPQKVYEVANVWQWIRLWPELNDD